MLRSRNISGPSNSSKIGYNNVVNTLNGMQREQAKELDALYQTRLQALRNYQQQYDEFIGQRDLLANRVEFIDRLIAGYGR